jgi:hypothetical protein
MSTKFISAFHGGKSMDRIDIKITENQLKQEFIQGLG